MMRRSIIPRRNSNLASSFFSGDSIDSDFREMINGLEDIWQGRGLSSESAGFGEMKETDNAYLLSVDMPGVKKEDLNIQVDNGLVTIEATRKTLFENGGGETRRISRSITVPQTINRDEVQAQMQDGILYLALPKSAENKSKRINVSDANESFVKLFADSSDKSSH
ncbi:MULTISPECIES: Hsp20/alpha crystallin family protein [Halobacteriovorax]|uniref:Hsp20/alpha crystallin family protein n=1 Tax=Halobacteriovorax vibrionivorans TaxID=2152716 RepID=A0ABY0IF13_9BACT|nr:MULTISPECIES: Hsp20/alpha crystallin family protein [Halobacteriovorax]AYF43934.1 Hsp20/alpha crystallin family protein [Halobacteriovorax sp. BALOs_7]RZF21535.1 Hsp20/alpha crystallin family protein [Halobacteriovorax vibrionivorans]TGD49172.1 Hsp20/alpha crystallin family protein [Halobacteriovorax sp. Y22]